LARAKLALAVAAPAKAMAAFAMVAAVRFAAVEVEEKAAAEWLRLWRSKRYRLQARWLH
jgi:hypothetical protein